MGLDIIQVENGGYVFAWCADQPQYDHHAHAGVALDVIQVAFQNANCLRPAIQDVSLVQLQTPGVNQVLQRNLRLLKTYWGGIAWDSYLRSPLDGFARSSACLRVRLLVANKLSSWQLC